MARLRAVLLLLFLPLLVSPLGPSPPLPYSLLRLVEFKATDELVEKELKLTPNADDGLTSTQKCLGSTGKGVGGELLCAAKSLFESQFDHGLIGSTSYKSIMGTIQNFTEHPCSHGESIDGSPQMTSSEVIIALHGGFILYGCHHYITLDLQQPKNKLLSNFAVLKTFKIPHSLIPTKECTGNDDPCTLTTVKDQGTLVAEDYTCCCKGTGCAAFIMDQGGRLNPLPLLRFNIQLDETLTGNINALLSQDRDARYLMGANKTIRRERHFLNMQYSAFDVTLTCLVFFTIVCVMSLLLCFQWFCKDTIINDA